MRIAVVGNGQSVHVLDRSAAVAARGHEVRLVTLGPVLEASGIEVRTRPLPVGPGSALSGARSFLEDLRSFRPEILHVHYAGGRLGTLATLAGIHPLVVSVMGGDVLPEQHPGGPSFLERRATRRLLEEADLLLAKSDALKVAIARFGDFAAKVETIRWGVDLLRFRRDGRAAAALRTELGLDPAARVVLSPRLLRPLYNIHLLVEAMALLARRVPAAVLLITEYNPDPAYQRGLHARVDALGLHGRVRFIGRRDHAEMPALLSLAEVAVSIPSSDGLPQSLFEAMACGTPVILGRLPAYAEVVTDGRTALLVDLRPEAIADGIERIIRQPAWAQDLSAAAQAAVTETASLSRAVERVDELYSRVRRASGHRTRTLARAADALSLLVR